MNLRKSLGIIFLLFTLVTALISCSRNSSPTEPDADLMTIPDSSTNGNRSVIAVYDMTIDPVAQTVELTQSDRLAEYHFPLTSIYPNVVKITGYSFTPNFWADIKISHPFPGSAICGFDPRVIAILPANTGVSFYYPTINVRANNKVVLEPDGYTKLFDNLGGSITGNTNPFKAYFKGQPYRAWYGQGVTQETQRWNLKLSGFGGSVTYKLVVDVSSNYPAAPFPRTDNAPEPVQIETEIGSGLLPTGGSASIDVTLLDWQGQTGIGGVYVEAPDLFNSIVSLNYSGAGPNPNEYVFSGAISNAKLAPAGDYKLLVATWDTASQVALYDEFKVAVNREGPYNPVDVTPEWLNISPIDLCVSGNKLYTVGEMAQGMHIFDITNPSSPDWLGSYRFENVDGYGIDADGDYAYITVGDYGLIIIDCNPPENPQFVKRIETPGEAFNVDYYNGYAYVADSYGGLQVIDVSPPENASIVCTVGLPDYGIDVFVANSTYAYVATSYDGLTVVNISTPESAYVVTYTGGEDANSIFVSGNYAYMGDDYGFTIVDISTPTAPVIVKYLEMSETTVDVMAFDGYAYVLGEDDAIYVVDVDPPASAYIYSQTSSNGDPRHLTKYLNYLYISEYGDGMRIFDISTPNTLLYAGGMSSLYYISSSVEVQGDYIFAVGYKGENYGFQVIHYNPLESAHIELSKKTVGYPEALDLQSNYLYIADTFAGLSVYDVSNPSNPTLAKNVPTTIEVEDIYVLDGYAYLSNRNTGMTIIDIEPLVSAHVDKTFDPSSWDYINNLEANTGYAFLAMWSNGLFVIDVDPPETASLIKEVYLSGGPQDVNVYGDYAYVTGEIIVSIVDINPPESSSKVKELPVPDSNMNGSCYSNGFLYVADRGNSGDRLMVLDVDPVDSTSIISSVELPHNPSEVTVVDNYAFVSTFDSGLRIVKLW